MEHENKHPKPASDDVHREGDPTHPSSDEEVVWSPEAWARLQNAPAFVRPGIKKLMALRAWERGLKVITSAFLTEMRNSSMMKVSRRLHRYGFEALSPETFEVAKAKMRRRPRKVEVIEEIQDHLEGRHKKNRGIIALFNHYFASMRQRRRPKGAPSPGASSRKESEDDTA